MFEQTDHTVIESITDLLLLRITEETWHKSVEEGNPKICIS
jgi:hypothetical protein